MAFVPSTGQDDAVDQRWYTNHWVWLIIAIPGLTVVGCMLTIWLAISNPHVLVKDPALDTTPATRTPRDALP
ncbi:MAG: FixH family protein [Woeseiaceae bacterium]|nr:FixH family protein [Woeseiaceae bacterium]